MSVRIFYFINVFWLLSIDLWEDFNSVVLLDHKTRCLALLERLSRG